MSLENTEDVIEQKKRTLGKEKGELKHKNKWDMAINGEIDKQWTMNKNRKYKDIKGRNDLVRENKIKHRKGRIIIISFLSYLWSILLIIICMFYAHYILKIQVC